MDSFTNVLSLCSGGGGLDLGFRLAVPYSRTVCYVENEVTACGVLAARMEEGKLDDAPIWTDLRSFDGAAWRGVVDCIIGGYPCQPFSNAGKRLGAADPRHLWPSVSTIVRDVQPEWCFFENVGAHLRLGFPEVARDLHEMGYQVAAGLFTAEEVGAPHKRERLFILAHSDSDQRAIGLRRKHMERETCDEVGWKKASDGFTNQRNILVDVCWPPRPGDDWSAIPERLWPVTVESKVRGVVDGLAGELGRSDQLHILGNGVVPQQAAHAFEVLYQAITVDL